MTSREWKGKSTIFDRHQEVGVMLTAPALARDRYPLSFADVEHLAKLPTGGEAMSSILLYKARGFEVRLNCFTGDVEVHNHPEDGWPMWGQIWTLLGVLDNVRYKQDPDGTLIRVHRDAFTGDPLTLAPDEWHTAASGSRVEPLVSIHFYWCGECWPLGPMTPSLTIDAHTLNRHRYRKVDFA